MWQKLIESPFGCTQVLDMLTRSLEICGIAAETLRDQIKLRII